jgi:NAD(P)-dependent dehydrogenase (short-subunit alcohol dehydrogenase family)
MRNNQIIYDIFPGTMLLSRKAALVTGSGMGRTTTLAFGKAGARVLVVDIDAALPGRGVTNCRLRVGRMSQRRPLARARDVNHAVTHPCQPRSSQVPATGR